MQTWNEGHLDEMIMKVYKRLKKVIVLIAELKGKNDLVETKRGKKFQDLDLPIDLMGDDTPELVAKLLSGQDVQRRGDLRDTTTPSYHGAGPPQYSAGPSSPTMKQLLLP